MEYWGTNAAACHTTETRPGEKSGRLNDEGGPDEDLPLTPARFRPGHPWVTRTGIPSNCPSSERSSASNAVPPQVREYLQFPPFGQDHLDNSLQHLSDLVA